MKPNNEETVDCISLDEYVLFCRWNTYGKTGWTIPFAIGVGNYDESQLRMIANGDTGSERVLTVTAHDKLTEMMSHFTNSIVAGKLTNVTSSFSLNTDHFPMSAGYPSMNIMSSICSVKGRQVL